LVETENGFAGGGGLVVVPANSGKTASDPAAPKISHPRACRKHFI
jgi:hypothetical protein